MATQVGKTMKLPRFWDPQTIRTALGRHAVVDRNFQLKHTGFLLGITFIVSMIVSTLNLILLNQNYSIFLELGLTHFPKMLAHLERERIVMNSLILGTIFGSLLFVFVFGLRYTGRIAAPLMILREHIKSSARGMWFKPEVRIRDSDEFHEVIDTYNYFYKAIRLQTRNDLKRLETIREKVTDPEVLSLVTQMIEEKTQQITIPEGSSVRP